MSADESWAQSRSAITVIRRVRDRIDREHALPLNVEELARNAHMSAGHLSREFRRIYGESPYSYLMTRRIERAMTLLRRGDLSVTEVCFAWASRRSERSAPDSPNWSGSHRARIAPTRPARRPAFRRAWRNR